MIKITLMRTGKDKALWFVDTQLQVLSRYSREIYKILLYTDHDLTIRNTDKAIFLLKTDRNVAQKDSPQITEA